MKYRVTTYTDCSINVSLNYKIPIVFHNIKNYDAHLITQELGKFDFKINVTQNGLEKYMRFSFDDKMIHRFTTFYIFTDSLQVLNSSLDTLVKNLSENDFKHLSQEFDNEVLDLVKRKVFYPYECIYSFEKFHKTLSSNYEFYSSLSGMEISEKEYQQFGKKLK